MKTITSLLLGILLSSLAILFIVFSIKSLILTTYTFNVLGSTDVYSFGTTFYFIALVQLLIAIVCIIASTAYYMKTRKYYNETLARQRDTNILNTIKEQKYRELFNELAKCSNVEEKEAVLAKFYTKNNPELVKSAVSRIISNWNIMNEQAEHKGTTMYKVFEEVMSKEHGV